MVWAFTKKQGGAFYVVSTPTYEATSIIVRDLQPIIIKSINYLMRASVVLPSFLSLRALLFGSFNCNIKVLLLPCFKASTEAAVKSNSD